MTVGRGVAPAVTNNIMALKDDILSDLDVFFDADEFAVPVTYNSLTFNGIYDNTFAEDDQGEIQVDTLNPQIMVKSSDVTSLAKGDTMTVNSIAYKVRSIQPDGTGVTTIFLTRD